jgi:hypothetical protein
MDATPGLVLGAGVSMATIGALLVAWGVRALRRKRARERGDAQAAGLVVENRRSIDTENSTLIHPIVEFTTGNGRTLRVELPWSTQVQYEVGATVAVHYDPAHPEQAGAIGQGRLPLGLLVAFGAFVIVFGLAFVALGLAGLVFGFPAAS